MFAPYDITSMVLSEKSPEITVRCLFDQAYNSGEYLYGVYLVPTVDSVKPESVEIECITIDSDDEEDQGSKDRSRGEYLFLVNLLNLFHFLRYLLGF